MEISRAGRGSTSVDVDVEGMLDRYARRRDRRDRDWLLAHFTPLARRCAARYTGRGEQVDDLLQVALLGLIRALDRFDPARGTPFRAFAIPTINGELRRYFRDHAWMMSVPRRVKEQRQIVERALERLGDAERVDTGSLAARTGIDAVLVGDIILSRHAYRPFPLDAVADRPAPDPQHEFDRVLDRCIIDRLLSVLPEREQTLLRLRHCSGLTQSQIGAALGISQVHVGRLLAASLERIRDEIAGGSDCGDSG